MVSFECNATPKMSKIDQIYLRAVMLYMSEMSKKKKSFGKLRLRAFQPYVEACRRCVY